VKKHIASGKPFMGICVGIQALFEGSAENPNVSGLGVVKGRLERFDDTEKSVPHIGWNSASTLSTNGTSETQSIYGMRPGSKYYYVHSFAVPYRAGELEKDGWTVATAKYGSEEFIGAIARDNILATQFHPEKSGAAGQRVLKAFLEGNKTSPLPPASAAVTQGLTRRIIACLDVRTNDQGDLVVTKGDQYDVREKSGSGGDVRNLGKPVSKAQEYYEQGADEVTFLNITSFRDTPLKDLPMLEVLRQASATVFVPLTIGGGIRDTTDPQTNRTVPALEVATLYFQSGADKVSIGSDACDAAEQYYAAGKKLSGKTAIETISGAYGAQAVVVSIDPKRVYVLRHRPPHRRDLVPRPQRREALLVRLHRQRRPRDARPRRRAAGDGGGGHGCGRIAAELHRQGRHKLGLRSRTHPQRESGCQDSCDCQLGRRQCRALCGGV
jgi:glutamine amidotransferase/cyclase